MGWKNMAEEQNPHSRSLSIIAIAILQGLVSLIALASGIFLVLLMTGTIQVFSQDLRTLSLPLKGLVALGLAISFWGLVVSYGLWHLKLWGWAGSIIFHVMCIVNNGLTVLAGQALSPQVYCSIAFSLSLMATLCLPRVRASFESTAPKVDPPVA